MILDQTHIKMVVQVQVVLVLVYLQEQVFQVKDMVVVLEVLIQKSLMVVGEELVQLVKVYLM